MLRELWDMMRTKEEVTTGAVRDVEEGAADDGIWGHYGPPKLGISLFSFVFLLCQGKGGGRHERGAAKRG